MTSIKAYCSECRGIRNCSVNAEHTQRGGDDDYQFQTSWQVLECQGCAHNFVLRTSTNSEDYTNYYEPDGSTGTEYTETVDYWPSLAKRERPEWMSSHGIDAIEVDELDEVLVELYRALDNDLIRLSAIGIRTAFEVAATALGVDANLSFSQRLDVLVKSQHVRPAERERLNTLIEGGNASAHRGWKPKLTELNTLMDILEHFIHDGFVSPQRKRRIDEKAAAMKAIIPARNK